MLKFLNKRNILIFLFSLPVCLMVQALQAAPLISEFRPNPTGTDPANSTFEISGDPNTMFTGWIISIESDNSSFLGVIDRAAQISGTFDSNGLLVVMVPDLENPSNTVVLTDIFTGTEATTDIDTNDDGIADDLSSFGVIYDAIGIPDELIDEAFLFGEDLGGTDFAYIGDEPRLVFRENSTGDLYALDDFGSGQVFNTSAVDVTPAIFVVDPTIGTDTFGDINPTLIRISPENIPVFGPLGLLTMVFGLFWYGRRRSK